MQCQMLLNRYYLCVPASAEGYCYGQISLTQEAEQAIPGCYLYRDIRQIWIGYPFNCCLQDFPKRRLKN